MLQAQIWFVTVGAPLSEMIHISLPSRVVTCTTVERSIQIMDKTQNPAISGMNILGL